MTLARPFSYAYATALPQEKTFAPNAHFQTDLFTGAATYDYDLKLPLGTNDLSPELKLSYNSYWRLTRPGIVGDGWRLTENYVQRFINFTRDDPVDDEFRLVLNGVSYTLLNSTTDNRYHSDLESFLDIQYFDTGASNANGNYWQVRTKDGTTYRFGYTPDSESVSNWNTLNLSWRWSLDLVTDLYDNTINYTYLEGSFESYGAIYPNNITYNRDGQRVIEFIYDTSDRPDIWRVYEEGNHINEKRRLKEISITANGQIVSLYSLAYNTTYKISYSLLDTITEIGSDGQQALPTTTFFYHDFVNSWTQDSSYNLPECCFVDSTTQEDQGMRLVDVNRDGLVDLVRARHTTPFNPAAAVWLNQKGSWGGTGEISYPGCSSATGNSLCIVVDGKDNGVRLADVNSDGFVDIIKAADPTSSGPTSSVYLGTGSGWTLSSTFLYPKCSSAEGDDLCFMKDEKDYAVQLAEVNGDGFIDIVKARNWQSGGASAAVWLNNGSGWLESATISYPHCPGGSDLCFTTTQNSVDGEDNGIRMVDVNNDGLDDIVRSKIITGSGGVSRIYFNTGQGWDWENGSIQAHFENTRCAGATTDGCFVDNNGVDQGVRLVDYNGDGLVDIVKAKQTGSSTGSSFIGLNTGERWAWNDFWTFPECDAGGSSNCFVDTNYADYATRMVDINGDGLADIVRARSSGQYATYLNDGYRTNLLQQINNSLGGSSHIYYEKATYLNSSGGADYIPDLGTPLLVVAKTVDYNGMLNGHIVNVTTDFNYSDGVYDYPKREFRGFGNVTEIKNEETIVSHLFLQDDSLKGREYETEIIDPTTNTSFQQQRYTWNATFKDGYYIAELRDENSTYLDGSSVTSKTTNTSYQYDIYGNVITKIQHGDVSVGNDDRYEYFDYVYNTTSWIVDGVKQYLLYNDLQNTTKLRETQYSYDSQSFGSTPLKGDITREEKVNNAGSNPITIYGYDNYGNVDNITDPNNNLTDYVFGLRDTTYTFADQEINAKGQTTNKWFDLGTGNLLNVSDANGFMTGYTYDRFGRIVTEVKPFDNDQYPTKTYTYGFDGVAPEEVVVTLRETSTTTNTLDLYEFVDGLGKIIQTKVEAENSKQIVEDIYYDGQLRIANKTNKYFIDFYVNYSEPSATVKFTNFTYDILGRVLQQTNADESVKLFSYDHWKETSLDEDANLQNVTKDAHGQITAVVEHQPEAATTNYTYNAAGELTNITDAAGNVILYFYDSLGRKTSQVDPDLGIWNYTYDGVGNLLTTKDNRAITTTYTYDELNRVTQKSTPSLTYTYAYDSLVAGTLSSINATNFSRGYVYDERLRLTGDQKIIHNTVFTQQFSYDALDRPLTDALAGGETITYTYTAQGILDSIQGIITSTTHNELHSPLVRTYANSLATTYIYNASNFRVESIVTPGKQNLNYEYSKGGDLLELNDTEHDRAYAMTYGNLSRLTNATRWDSGAMVFDFSYVYNAIGNIMYINSTREQLLYSYNGTMVHAPYQINYTFTDGLVVHSLSPLSGTGLQRVFEFIINNTETFNMTDVSWRFDSGTQNITSQGNLTLQSEEDLFVYVDYTYSSGGAYPVIVAVSSVGRDSQIFTDQITLNVTVP